MSVASFSPPKFVFSSNNIFILVYRIYRTRSGIGGAAAKFDTDGQTRCEAAVFHQTHLGSTRYDNNNIATLRMLGYKSRGITQVAWIYMERLLVMLTTVQYRDHFITRILRISAAPHVELAHFILYNLPHFTLYRRTMQSCIMLIFTSSSQIGV